MQDELKKLLKIDETREYEFRNIYGFTFAFMRKIVYLDNRLTFSEIKPVGIIYEENGEYYFAPLDKVVDITAVVKEFVKSELFR